MIYADETLTWTWPRDPFIIFFVCGIGLSREDEQTNTKDIFKKYFSYSKTEKRMRGKGWGRGVLVLIAHAALERSQP